MIKSEHYNIVSDSFLNTVWQTAHRHHQASQVGIPKNVQNMQLCSCCFQAIQKEPINLCEHTKQFQIFGFGYPLWYSFLKYCGILVLVLIISNTASSIYQATKQNREFCYGSKSSEQHSSVEHNLNLYKPFESHRPTGISFRNHQSHITYDDNQQSSLHYYTNQQHRSTQSTQKSSQHGNHKVQCTSFMIYLSRFQSKIASIDDFMRIIQFFAHLVTLIYIRNGILKQEQYYDERTCSMSDYSIVLSNLPLQTNIKSKITQMLKKQFNKQIQQIILFPNDKLIQKLDKILQQCIQEQEKCKAHPSISFYSQERENVRNQKKHIQEEISKQINKLRKQIDQDTLKTEMAIIVLSSQQDKADVLERYQQDKTYHQYFGVDSHIKIKQTPQPKQIIWQNIFVGSAQRKVKIALSWIFSILFLSIVTVIFYFIMLAKTNFFLQALEIQHHENAGNLKTIATIIVFCAIFGVVLFNKFLMGKVLHIFVHFQKQVFSDHENLSFAIKYAIGMFFTTALMTLAVQAITYKNFYSHNYGVIEQETIMFFVTSFFVPLIWLINPFHLSVKIKRYFYHLTHMKQAEANQLMENFPYDLGKRYAQIIQIMWFTFLYSSLIPIGSVLTLIGLFLYYWVDKYNFLRRSTLKEGVSGKMAVVTLKLLDVTLFLVPAGQLLFDYILRSNFDLKTAIFALIAIIYILLPTSEMILSFNQEKFYLQQKKYKQAKSSFKHTYYNLHPIYTLTHESQIQHHRKQVVKHYIQKSKSEAKMYSTGRGHFGTQKDGGKTQEDQIV